MKKRIAGLVLALLVLSSQAISQSTEIKLTLNEQFFEALLEAVFTHLDEPSVAISERRESGCVESIKLKKEIDGVKTAVKFSNGKILAPIAFEGSYKAPFVGCLDFSGVAETEIELFFNRNSDAIFGRAEVMKVNLSGSNGLGAALLGRFVQNSIDEKLNPIEIIKLQKLSFETPIKDSGTLKMKATGFKYLVIEKAVEIIISYRFEKAI